MKVISIKGYSKLISQFSFEDKVSYEVWLNNKVMFKTKSKEKANEYFELLHKIECLSYEDSRELNIIDVIVHNED